MGQISGTSGASQFFAALAFAAAATYGTASSGTTATQRSANERAKPLVTTNIREERSDGREGTGTFVSSCNAAATLDSLSFTEVSRATTGQEEVIGELREALLLNHNWDGEGAQAPNHASIREAVSFVRLLGANLRLPEVMLHPSGRAGLFWHDGEVYADLEFTGNQLVTYYIERDGGKHKGVVPFDSTRMPRVFSTLLVA